MSTLSDLMKMISESTTLKRSMPIDQKLYAVLRYDHVIDHDLLTTNMFYAKAVIQRVADMNNTTEQEARDDVKVWVMEYDYSTPVTLSEIATKLIEVHEITTIVYSADHYVPYPSPVVVDYDETEFHFGGDTSFKFRFTMSPMLVNRITVLDAVLRAAFPIASEGYFEFDCTDEVEVEEIIGNHYGAFKITIHEDGWAMLINHDPTDDYYSRTRKIKIIRQV